MRQEIEKAFVKLCRQRQVPPDVSDEELIERGHDIAHKAQMAGLEVSFDEIADAVIEAIIAEAADEKYAQEYHPYDLAKD